MWKRVLFLSFYITFSYSLKLSSIENTYQKGVDAYTGERWSECIAQFEESLHLYKLYKTITINCRLRCNSQKFDKEVKDNIEELQAYERIFHTRNCLKSCLDTEYEHSHMNGELDEGILKNLQQRKPYEYVHLCYFQMNMLPKAASAAYTYLVGNPDDESMINNVKYYLEQPEVDAKEVTDLLGEDYTFLYQLGLKAYKESHWQDTIGNMEEVISQYMLSENACRVECERQTDQEWSPEFTISISNSIAQLLQCRQNCQNKLKALDYDSGLEFLAEILNYLQISYYRVERYNDAAKAVASCLAIIPDNEDMLENKRIYSTITTQDAFAERSDIIYYLKRDNYEKKLLQFFHQGSDNHNIQSNFV